MVLDEKITLDRSLKINSTLPGFGMFLVTKFSLASCSKSLMQSILPSWFEVILDRDETALLAKGVSKRYWGYILANGVPGTPQHDGLGAIYKKRQHLVAALLPSNRTMGIAVVDGRDLETIRKWIGGPDWSAEEEAKWLQSI